MDDDQKKTEQDQATLDTFVNEVAQHPFLAKQLEDLAAQPPSEERDRLAEDAIDKAVKYVKVKRRFEQAMRERLLY